MTTTTTLSFEFFPPKDEAATERLIETATTLSAFAPAFMSVTYGAGGTTRDRTAGALAILSDHVEVPLTGHLTCVGDSLDQTHGVIDGYAALGIDRIVALRGDRPEDGATPVDELPDAAALVTAIRNRPDGDRYDISVAAYPEVHPLAESPSADLDNLRRKLDAGADRALTQFFFETESFLRFRDRVAAAGITAPLVPGIMPIASAAGAFRFAGRCGTRVPEWLPRLFDGLDDEPEIRRSVAVTVAVEQCDRLRSEGVDAFHFYTLNRADLSAAVCRLLAEPARPTLAEATRPAVAEVGAA